MKADHVVIDTTGPRDRLTLRCLHCGETLAIVLPAGVDALAMVGNGFAKLHRGCVGPKAKP